MKYGPILSAIYSGATKAGAWLAASRVRANSVIAGSGEMLAHSARRLDAHLRKKQGIFEFCDHPHCLLRVAVRRTEENLVLSDAIRLRRGELIAELHLWNEHIPQIPEDGPKLSWAVLTQRRMRHSLALLADQIRSGNRLDQVRVFHARALFGNGKSQARMERFAKLYGFELARTPPSNTLPGRLRNLGECLHQWALIRAFNPSALAGRRLTHVACHQLWISRDALLVRFPTPLANAMPLSSGVRSTTKSSTTLLRSRAGSA
ncbi:MAG: hypothetical protein JWR69_3978 [Pedosphaera sp.]|nr:hypothetical protein [Pedosphaera sp.]